MGLNNLAIAIEENQTFSTLPKTLTCRYRTLWNNICLLLDFKRSVVLGTVCQLTIVNMKIVTCQDCNGNELQFRQSFGKKILAVLALRRRFKAKPKPNLTTCLKDDTLTDIVEISCHRWLTLAVSLGKRNPTVYCLSIHVV